MTNETERLDLNEFEFGGLAEKLLKEGNLALANSALMTLNESLRDTSPTKKLLQKTIYNNPTPRSVQDAAEIYSEAHQERLGSATIGDLTSYYNPFIDSTGEEDANTLRDELGEFSGETYSDIQRGMERASYDLEGIEKGFTKDRGKGKAAEETIKRYQHLVLTLKALEDTKMESLKSEVTGRYHVEGLKTIAKDIRGK